MIPIDITVPPDLWQRFQHAVRDTGLTLTPTTGTQRYILGVAPVPIHYDPSLSSGERDCLARVAAGMTDAQIARALGVSEECVKARNRRTRRTLGAKDRAHAVHLAHERGLLGGAS